VAPPGGLRRTVERRPDLAAVPPTDEEARWLAELRHEAVMTTACSSERSDIMDAISVVEAGMLKRDRGGFRPGDTVCAHVKIVEGEPERVQIFGAS
jgi:hypothetical protein